MEESEKEYLELTYVSETATGKGLNKMFVMDNLHDGTFRITDGRVGIRVGPNKPRKSIRPTETRIPAFLQSTVSQQVDTMTSTGRTPRSIMTFFNRNAREHTAHGRMPEGCS